MLTYKQLIRLLAKHVEYLFESDLEVIKASELEGWWNKKIEHWSFINRMENIELNSFNERELENFKPLINKKLIFLLETLGILTNYLDETPRIENVLSVYYQYYNK